MSDDEPDEQSREVVRFPQTRVRPPGGLEPVRQLGLGKMVEDIGLSPRQITGHWCSRCNGLWYGALLEVTCPVCGNRQG